MNKQEYQEYLQSPHWKRCVYAMHQIRTEDCELCSQPSEEYHIHHMSYERIGNEQYSDLIKLCDKCHKYVHKNGVNITRQKDAHFRYREEMFYRMVYCGCDRAEANEFASDLVPSSEFHIHFIGDCMKESMERFMARAKDPKNIIV